MSLPMLVVDKDSEVSQREQAEWDKRGIGNIRVNTMCEAVLELTRQRFLFTAINADTVDYLPMLGVISNAARSPVFIITSHFSLYDQVEAIHHGADAYVPFQQKVEENIMLALALINRYNKRNGGSGKSPEMIVYDELLIFPCSCQVFHGNMEIHLTKTEFDILLYLVCHRGIVLTYRQIYREVWGSSYDAAGHRALWNQVHNLRRKIDPALNSKARIECVREVGYRIPAQNGK